MRVTRIGWTDDERAHAVRTRSSTVRPTGSAGLEATLAGSDKLALAPDGWLLVVLSTADLGEDAVLLDLLVEAPKSTLEGLALTDLDLRHMLGFTSSSAHARWVRAEMAETLAVILAQRVATAT